MLEKLAMFDDIQPQSQPHGFEVTAHLRSDPSGLVRQLIFWAIRVISVKERRRCCFTTTYGRRAAPKILVSPHKPDLNRSVTRRAFRALSQRRKCWIVKRSTSGLLRQLDFADVSYFAEESPRPGRERNEIHSERGGSTWCREGDFIFWSKPGPRYQQVGAFSVT